MVAMSLRGGFSFSKLGEMIAVLQMENMQSCDKAQ